MTEPGEQPDDEPIGWQVTDPDGNVVAAGGQTGIESASGTGETAGDVNGSD